MAGNIDAAYFYQAVIQSLEGLVNDVQTAMVKKKLEKPDGKTVEEKKYYISSLPVDVELFFKSGRRALGSGGPAPLASGFYIQG